MALTKFQERLAYLDAALTGKPWADVLHTARSQNVEPLDVLGREYYLSDGGYSRVVISDETLRLFLTSNSLDRPRANWINCRELIADVERDVAAAVEGGSGLMASCERCSGREQVKLGVLGLREWFRCRACGWLWSRRAGR